MEEEDIRSRGGRVKGGGEGGDILGCDE